MLSIERAEKIGQSLQDKNDEMRDKGSKGIIPAVKDYQEQWEAVCEFEGLLMSLQMDAELYPIFLAEYKDDIALFVVKAKKLADDTDLLAVELDKYVDLLKEATA